MFYTVTLPCTLWFLDRGKKKTQRTDKVLFVDARHIYRQIDRAHRDWSEAQVGFLANLVRLYRGEEPDFILGGHETESRLIECFYPSLASTEERAREGKKGAALRAAEPSARYLGVHYRDIPGLCKAASLKEIEAQSWSLNPGRYVGVAPGEEVSDEDFKEKLETLNEELETLNAQARELEETIARNVAEILET
jgi:type I restriction enzyme M protein